MRKRLTLIICILALVAVLSVCAACSSSSDFAQPKRSENTDAISQDDHVYSLLEEFSSYEDRFYSSAGSHSAAQFIANKMSKYGAEPLPVEASLNIAGGATTVKGADAFFAVAKQESKSVNLYFRRPASTDKSLGTVIIMAHYDNLFGAYLNGDLITATGAYDNAASVATVLNTAKTIDELNVAIDYDIIFAFVSATSVAERDSSSLNYSWQGARQMVKTLTKLNLMQDVVLAINAWRLGGGENTYMYSYDRPTTYNEYFYEVARINGLNFTPVPEYKRSFSLDAAATISDSVTSPTGLMHIGMMNDSVVLMNENIPTLTYLSLDWSDVSNPGYTEKRGFSNCAGTNNDTLDNMILINGAGETGKNNIFNKLSSVTQSLIASLEGDNGKTLSNTLSLAGKELKAISSASKAMYYTALGITITAVIALIAVYVILRKKNIMRLNSQGNRRPPNAGNTGSKSQSDSPFEDFPAEEKIFEEFD